MQALHHLLVYAIGRGAEPVTSTKTQCRRIIVNELYTSGPNDSLAQSGHTSANFGMRAIGTLLRWTRDSFRHILFLL